MRPRSEVHPDWVPKDSYLSPTWCALEFERLWPRAWQVACREEEIANVGDFVEYAVAEQSVVVVRVRESEIRAFHNVCQHRGRTLVQGVGNIKQFRCGFHAWRWNLDGSIKEVVDVDDFPDLCETDVGLKKVNVGTWGGFVFINMDPNAVELSEWLSPVNTVLEPYELDRMRFRWYKQTIVDCNWKVALEAFNESYHVTGTHPQLLRFIDNSTVTRSAGRHGSFVNTPGNQGIGLPDPRLKAKGSFDPRTGVRDFLVMIENDLKAQWSERDASVADRLTELPDGVSNWEVLGEMLRLQEEAAIADGAGWPAITPEQMMAAGTDWHVFPALIILPYPDAALVYRARPHGTDPGKCRFDVWSLVRYRPGGEPPLHREVFSDYRDHGEGWGRILLQDFGNMSEVQRGMRSLGFDGARINTRQEGTVSNFHRALYEFMGVTT